MDKRLPWEANSHLASQIPLLLRNSKFHYRIHKSTQFNETNQLFVCADDVN